MEYPSGQAFPAEYRIHKFLVYYLFFLHPQKGNTDVFGEMVE